MSRWIRLSDSKRRDARVRMTPRQTAPPARVQSVDGRPVESAKLIKTPLPQTYEVLGARCEDDAELAQLLIEADPEIDLEAAGRRTGPTDRILLDTDGQALYSADEVEVILDRDGHEIERRIPVTTPANINAETPLVWTGKILCRSDAVQRYAFTRQYQIRHVDGLTFDFLFAMAEELDQADNLALIGAGARGREPIIPERNGLPYRGFLEGRIRDEKYLLILHLSHLELKIP